MNPLTRLAMAVDAASRSRREFNALQDKLEAMAYQARLSKEEMRKGVWRTIRGAHVFIQNGRIVKGPPEMRDWDPAHLMHKAKKDMKRRRKAGKSFQQPEPPRQPASTKEEVYTHSGKAKLKYDSLLDMGQGVSEQIHAKTFHDMMAALDEMNEPGPMVILAPIKSPKRAEEKVNADYGGDWSRLTDLVRGSIVVDTFDDVERAYAALEQEAKLRRFKIIEVKNRFHNPTPAGYRDMNVRLKGPDGHICELQINVKTMVLTKEKLGHKLYEEMRSLEAAAASQGRQLSEQEMERRNRLAAEMAHLYREAWEAATVELQ